MSDSKPLKRICSALIAGKAAEAELQQLKILLLDSEKRVQFLEQLESKCTEVLCLESKPFAMICDALGEIVEESDYDDDYDALLRVYRVSGRICTSSNGNIHTALVASKASLESRYWTGEMFWAQSVIDMIRKDMNLWSKITFIMRENHIKDTQLFGDLSSSQIRAVLVISRIQAIVASLRSLDVSNDCVSAVLNEISAQFSFADIGIDIATTSAVRVTQSFLLRALAQASSLFLPTLAKRKRDAQSQSQIAQQNGTIYSKLSLANNVVDFVPKTADVPLHYEAGYCPLLELIFGVYIYAIKQHTRRESSGAVISADEQTELLASLSANPSPVTRCFCGDAVRNWAFIDTNRCIERDISPKLSLILTAVAAGQDPRLLNSRGEVAAPPTRARSNSGRFNLQNGLSFYSPPMMDGGSNNSSNGALGSDSVSRSPLAGAALCSRVLSHMMCERCYRHMLSPPLALNCDAIVCAGLVPLPSHIAPLSDNETVFERVMNLEEKLSDDAGGKGVDFALFDKNLSALLKRPGQDGGSGGSHSVKNAGASAVVGGVSSVVAAAFRTDSSASPDRDAKGEDEQESDDLIHGTTMPPRHGLESHHIRNSRDLTRRTRPVSLVSVNSNVSSGGESAESEELHVVRSSSQELSADAKILNERYAQRALPPDPLSPTSAQGSKSRTGSAHMSAASATPPIAGGSAGKFGIATPVGHSITTGSPSVMASLSIGDTPRSEVTSLSSIASPNTPMAERLRAPPPTMVGVSPSTESPKTVTPAAKDKAARKKDATDLVPFIEQLWEGLTVKIIYSSKPLVEKARILYLRAGTEKANKLIRERLVPIGTEVTEAQRQYTHRALLDAVRTALPLQLCWGRRSVMGSVSFSSEKCLDLDTIKHIKVGSGVWSQCINIGSSTGRALVLRLEDEAMFARVLEGITSLVESRSAKP